jgi:hypothetical protein
MKIGKAKDLFAELVISSALAPDTSKSMTQIQLMPSYFLKVIDSSLVMISLAFEKQSFSTNLPINLIH